MNEKQILDVSLHEAWHFAVASELGVAASPTVFDQPVPQTTFAGGAQMLLLGECELAGRVSNFELSVIGWAGAVGEGLLGTGGALSVPFRLTKTTLRDFYSFAMANFSRLSLGDQVCVGRYKNPWLSFKACYRIARRSKGRVLRLGKAIAAAKQREAGAAAPSEPAQPFNLAAWQLNLVETHLARLPEAHPDRPRFERARTLLRTGERLTDSNFFTGPAPQQAGKPLTDNNSPPPLEASGLGPAGFVAEGDDGVQPAQEPTMEATTTS
jgi:hypothetical protein